MSKFKVQINVNVSVTGLLYYLTIALHLTIGFWHLNLNYLIFLLSRHVNPILKPIN
jgi:hypothetical protein